MSFNKNIKRAYSFLASLDFGHLLITFANGLESDQDRKEVSPNLYPNYFIVFLKDFYE